MTLIDLASLVFESLLFRLEDVCSLLLEFLLLRLELFSFLQGINPVFVGGRGIDVVRDVLKTVRHRLNFISKVAQLLIL